MSTVIHVYPSSDNLPTLDEFSAAVRAVLLEYQKDPAVVRILGEIDEKSFVPKVERLTSEGEGVPPQRIDDSGTSLAFSGSDYGWLSIRALEVGFDFYFTDADRYFEDARHREVVKEDEHRAQMIDTLDGFPFDRAAEVGWGWFMRLQAAQPPRTRLIAGFAAAALARLTHAYLNSDDGGLDYDRAPTDPETFLSWYPEWIEQETRG